MAQNVSSSVAWYMGAVTKNGRVIGTSQSLFLLVNDNQLRIEISNQVQMTESRSQNQEPRRLASELRTVLTEGRVPGPGQAANDGSSQRPTFSAKQN